ncbi:MAG: methionine--tRNA ligase, partial [Myxococcales bacterium]|nr:methionine--tRNA ligase [Myxococcales bacterium]
MTPPRIVTAALPYANGSLHIGHLLEYCQADMYTRALNRLGENALYICASDSHGTPIELNAQSQGIPPETLV